MPEGNLFAIGGDFFQHQGGGVYGGSGVNATGSIKPVTIAPSSLALAPQTANALNGNISIPLQATSAPKSNNGLFGKDTWKSGGAGWAVLGAASNALDAVPTGERRGLWDTLDPVHHLAGGRESGVGNTLGDTGVALTKAGISSGSPWLALAGAGLKVVGGLTNAAFGIKTDKEALAAANQSINANKNFVSNASSFDDIKGPASMTNTNVYKGGWFSGGKADRKNQELAQQMQDAYSWADRSIDNNIDNLAADQLNNSLMNYAAFGGPLEQMAMDNSGIGAIGYGFMSDYITAKKQQNGIKNKLSGMTATPAFMRGFALGGDLQTHGADWTNGLYHIDEGQSHELNPNDGVQIGVDSQGIPNLVEEGERIFNDYVYSKRIMADGGTLEKFHLSKKKKISFADLAEYLEKESQERPNDPISSAGLKANMAMLAEQQERQKQEMEAQRAREAFEALPPEQQAAIMQQAAQEQQAQQAAMTEQQAAMQQPSQEEMLLAQQQQMADGSEAALGQEPDRHYIDDGAVSLANGGRINKFDKGGPKNSGKFKDDKADNWGIFTRPGLEAFIESYRNRLNMAETEEQKKAIRKEAMDEFNAIQKGYADIYQDSSSGNFEYSDAVKKHQMNFDKAKGNTGFYSRDDAGNVKNLIAEAIDMPKGHATDDKPDSWYDGYWGPRTSIRNFGSTAYGNDDYYKPLVDAFRELGLTYAPNAEWKHGDNMLYGLSMAEAPAKEKTADWTPEWQGNNPQTQVITIPSTQPSSVGTSSAETEENVAPVHRNEKLRYAGLLGPAVGLGLQLSGVGKPDYSRLDSAISTANNPAHLASYQPLGNYLTYRPMDIWYEQNRMDANSRATDRNIMNTSGGNRGTAMAGLLTNSYNTQIADGTLFRQAQEYNDALRAKVAEFNRGTDQFNADAYNRTSQFNAQALNNAQQHSAQLGLQAAAQRLGTDASWYNSLYGNIGSLFKGISDMGRENAQWNMISDMWADGLAGTATEKTNSARGHLKKKKSSNGGKIERRGIF